MPSTSMHLKILLPFMIFTEKQNVLRIVAESRDGAFGLLPHRLDCAASLVAGIFVYETEAEGEVCIAVDEGVLVKTGTEVLVSVRNAIGGTNLGALRATVDQQFLTLNEQEKTVRSALAKMEVDFTRRFTALHRE
ncbi:F0F1 ATP synthase subunit epsilon [Chitinimonas sp. BJB300]|uniref:F0F1 ATP synthase subunit epsilon n=1 Tax=Chitinimonas sp. BJB300 TaxID=1559339 RepID=UPI000C0E6D0B|nr:F0F1 ATP synthase subunit epsilon [Chitinimonas sp. BJB300]PHV10560.1 F0F1 ATP synthase subunit epsilon [Chitinimonas sp. BJB300]TSJ87069.1 F0F1 ATP synthase subunit epsilon [Chitinimonas sp. BJB300]